MQSINLFKKILFLFSFLILTFDIMLISIINYVFLNTILLTIVFLATNSWKNRFTAVFIHGIILAIQICFAVIVIDSDNLSLVQNAISIFASYILLFFSFCAEHFLEIKNYQSQYFHDSTNPTILSFGDIKKFKQIIEKNKCRIDKVNDVVTFENINEIIKQISRNSSFSYINKGTLTENYFEDLEKTLTDNAVYIVVSDTGSVTSQFISIFTEKPYNHASIAFDSELKTLISYNGGERVNPPGLNGEQISFLLKKENSAIYIYKLDVSYRQKKMMIDKIRDINKQGSAYNFIGLAIKKSVKPNIMYCSQFVYSLLKYAGANYFEKNANDIKPTDLIELDYDRKLSLEYKIKF